MLVRVQTSEVPSWMFMLWISQMLAILDKPEAPTIHHILLDVTNNYPQVGPLVLCVTRLSTTSCWTSQTTTPR